MAITSLVAVMVSVAVCVTVLTAVGAIFLSGPAAGNARVPPVTLRNTIKPTTKITSPVTTPAHDNQLLPVPLTGL